MATNPVEATREANDSSPKCPYCQAIIRGGDHFCQKSPQDDHYRQMWQTRAMTADDIQRDREFYDMVEGSVPAGGMLGPLSIRRPWEK